MSRVWMLPAVLALASSALFAADPASPAGPQRAAAERYAGECGTCHIAYPAKFLPARSWQRLMDNLANHFGDNAELGEADRQQITGYLLAGAGDKSSEKRATKFTGSIPADTTPLRITELPYFKREHREIPRRYIRDNAQVGSLSNCAACHTRAEQGSFREREIAIPGMGRWEDD
ncbi:MAG TPA: diheme cytochrome c [Gammaproteobacteria bacterium]